MPDSTILSALIVIAKLISGFDRTALVWLAIVNAINAGRIRLFLMHLYGAKCFHLATKRFGDARGRRVAKPAVLAASRAWAIAPPEIVTAARATGLLPAPRETAFWNGCSMILEGLSMRGLPPSMPDGRDHR